MQTRLLTAAIGLSCASAAAIAAEPIWRHESNYEAVSRQRPRGDAVVTYVLKRDGTLGSYVADCDKVFGTLEEKFLGPLREGAFFYEATTMCSARDGIAAAFQLYIAVEPRTAGDLPAFEAYLTAHQGRRVYDTVFRFEPSIGTMVALSVQSGLWETATRDWFNLRYEDRRMIMVGSYGEAWRIDGRALESWIVADDPQTAFSLLEELVGPWTRSFYGNRIMPEVNTMTLSVGKSIIMPDGGIYGAGYGTNWIRDCRVRENGRCI